MTTRREVLIALGGLAALPVFAQQQGKVYRVGYLSGGSEAGQASNLASFRQGMQGLGYTVGQNLLVEGRYADGDFARLPALAAELIRGGPDALLVSTTPGSLAAKAATQIIPVVFVGVADPVGVKLVSNLARPDANVTGITNIVAELTGKRLEILKEIVPGATRIALLYNPDDPNASLQLRNAEAAARALKVSLHLLTLRTAGDVDRAFVAATKLGASAMLRLVDPTISMFREQSVQLAVKNRLPSMFAFPDDVEAGGLASYGPSLQGQYRQAATFMHKILQGAKPGALPVEQPTTIEMVLNQKTAKAMGITFPQTILLRADRVID